MILNFIFLRNWAIINYFFMFHIPSAWTIMYCTLYSIAINILKRRVIFINRALYKKEKINHDYNFSIFLIIQFF